MTKVFAALATIAVVLILSPLVGVIFGALSGWVVGLLFDDIILGFLSRLDVNTADLSLWQVGAALGFLGSFCRPSISQAKA